MATNKRKVYAKCRSFQDKRTNEFFFVEVKGKPAVMMQTLSTITAQNVQNWMC